MAFGEVKTVIHIQDSGKAVKLMDMVSMYGATATDMKESGEHVCVMETAQTFSQMKINILANTVMVTPTVLDNTSGQTVTLMQENSQME